MSTREDSTPERFHEAANDPAPVKLFTTEVNGEPMQTVNARHLHVFLGVGRDFTNWIKDQVVRARLVEHRDYVLEVFAEKGENPTGGRPRRECFLTIEAGKHIAMMAGTDKGFEVRDYFMECERRAKRAPALPDFSNPAAAARAWAEQFEQRERLARENEAQAGQLAIAAPKAAAYDAVAARDTLVTATQIGQKFGMSGIAFNKILDGWEVYSMGTKRARVFRQWFMDKGFGLLRETPSGHSQPLFTKTGEQWAVERLVSEGYTEK